MEEWTPEPFNLAKKPVLQSTVEFSSDPGFSGNFPRTAKWCVTIGFLFLFGLTISVFQGLQMVLWFWHNARTGLFNYLTSPLSFENRFQTNVL